VARPLAVPRVASLVACVVVVLVAGACTRSPAGGEPTGQRSSQAPGALTASLDGVTLTAVVDPNPVRHGEPVSFTASLRNDRGVPVDFSPGGCAFADLRVTFPVPWEPTGRRWTGRGDWFKTYLLDNAYAPGGVSARSPIDATLLSTPCDETLAEPILLPNETLTADFSRAIGNALDANSHTSRVPFSISVDLDRQNDPPPIDPRATGFPPRFFPIYLHLTVAGELKIDGPATDFLTAGEAIDALLGDERFATWLLDQPDGTCETANLFLDRPRVGEPTVWIIDLFCETGVPRHFAFAWIDAITGDIRRLDICDDPCDR
jgi:hypothetical protein